MLNIPIFLPNLGSKYSCSTLQLLWLMKFALGVSITSGVSFMSFAYIVHILLIVPLIIEHLASEECSVCWLVLPFRERNNFIQPSKNISL